MGADIKRGVLKNGTRVCSEKSSTNKKNTKYVGEMFSVYKRDGWTCLS